MVVDAYHVWWDDTVYAQIARAGARIAAFQVCDWVTPLPDGLPPGRAVLAANMETALNGIWDAAIRPVVSAGSLASMLVNTSTTCGTT